MMNATMARHARLWVFAFFGVVLAFLAGCARNPDEPQSAPTDMADKVFLGGPIYANAENDPQAEAVAIRGGVITAVGARNEIEAFIGTETEIIDLAGAAMYPGFTDAHAHLLGIGMRELQLNLEGVSSIEELVDIIAAHVQETEPGQLVFGRGWIETGWPENRFPNRGDLDPVSPDNPVILIRADGHAAVVNSVALSAASIDAQTDDPYGGRILRGEDNAPNGVLIDRAMALVDGLMAKPSESQRLDAYELGARVYAAYGWTGIHNMSVDPQDISLMEGAAAADGVIPIRVYNSLEPAGFDWLTENAPQNDASGRIVTRALKLYADGALGSRGAALSAPYSDQPDTSGLTLMKKEDALPILMRALETGVQINTHAIGDRANKFVLDWYEEALDAVPPENRKVKEPRWRIEHAQILHIEDIPRMRALGVIPSMQPSHAIGDLHFAPARLGSDRLDGAYAWRSLIDTGAIIAGGSDAPVERGDPLIEFYAAIARKDLDGVSGPDWRPEQAVTREEALNMFTLWPAIASFQETKIGTIAVGKRADFSVFSADIMVIPESEIPVAHAIMTVVDGEIVYRADGD